MCLYAHMYTQTHLPSFFLDTLTNLQIKIHSTNALKGRLQTSLSGRLVLVSYIHIDFTFIRKRVQKELLFYDLSEVAKV